MNKLREDEKSDNCTSSFNFEGTKYNCSKKRSHLDHHETDKPHNAKWENKYNHVLWEDVKLKFKDKTLEKQILVYILLEKPQGNTVKDIYPAFEENYSELQIETALEKLRIQELIDIE